MAKMILMGGSLLAIAASVALVMPYRGSVPMPASAKPAPEERKGTPPSRPLSLLFLHHSIGGQLLAEPGEGEGKDPRGGGFRKLLEGANYRVHEATYGSELGEHTDLFDWPEKFQKHMTAVLTTKDGAASLPDGEKHDVVMFKSCYPNNYFEGLGEAPGKPNKPLTVENAKAALSSLLPEFEKHPETLFVYLTAPPVAPTSWPERGFKWAIKLPLGKTPPKKLERQSQLARTFNDWVTSEDGWLADYPLKNVAVIDYYDILTGNGASNNLMYPTGDGADSHPSVEGQRLAAPRILNQLNLAVERAGLARAAEQQAPLEAAPAAEAAAPAID